MAAVNNNVVDPNKKNTNTGNPVNLPLADPNQPSPTPLPGSGDPAPAPTPYSGAATSSAGAVNPSHNATIYDNPNTKFTDAEWEAILGMYNISDPEYYNDLYTFGGYTQDLEESKAHGGTTTPQKYSDGSDGWYLYYGADRPDYSSDADATFLNGVGYYITTQNKNEWHRLEKLKKEATARGDTAEVARLQAEQDNLHIINEKIRAGAGYSGGVDGSMYYVFSDENSGSDIERGDPNAKGNSGSGLSDPSSELRGLLDAWQQAALQQSNGQIDYAVAKAVADLERALQDAQPQFKEQAETVAREERQALDNSALYAEMRGDKGGIGQEQYNSIQNTAAQNHLAVQQAQTKLATDTQRQIADLRAQGEFEKADAALQITQQYLQQLVGIEQWAKEYNLSTAQFQESIRQWEAEYQLAMQQLQTSQNQWQQEFAFQQQQYANSLNQWQQEFDYGKQSDLANVGWALLESGIPLSEEQMSAMGIDPGQASQILMQQQLEAALKNNGDTSMDYTGLFEAAQASGHPQSFIANNYKKYGFTSSTGLYNDYKSWEEQPVEPSLQDLDLISVSDLGIGAMLSYNEIERMVEMGVLTTYESGDKIGVKWANGWNAAKWKASDKGLGNGGILGFQGLT